LQRLSPIGHRRNRPPRAENAANFFRSSARGRRYKLFSVEREGGGVIVDVDARRDGAAMSIGGAIGAPSTAWAFDFNILPLGQQLWLKHLETFKEFPPLQAPETFNLDQVLQQVKSGSGHPSD